jgi:hypothetical protein
VFAFSASRAGPFSNGCRISDVSQLILSAAAFRLPFCLTRQVSLFTQLIANVEVL